MAVYVTEEAGTEGIRLKDMGMQRATVTLTKGATTAPTTRKSSSGQPLTDNTNASALNETISKSQASL